MASPPGWRRNAQPASFNADNRRWAIIVIVLIASLVIAGIERWLRQPDAPIVGNAFIVDGDTLSIASTRIRLLNIDAPELDQTCTDAIGRDWPCGRQASSQLRSHVRGRDLTCQPQALDKYGRSLAICLLPDKTDVNAWMVQQGWAVSYDYANVYGPQQTEAKSAKRGIWAGPFTPPRDWRQQHPRTSESDRKD